jgi:hypothetical protein
MTPTSLAAAMAHAEDMIARCYCLTIVTLRSSTRC